jgi:hypothetical protein
LLPLIPACRARSPGQNAGMGQEHDDYADPDYPAGPVRSPLSLLAMVLVGVIAWVALAMAHR